MKTYRFMTPLLAFFISGPLFGAAESTPDQESPLMLSEQNETKLACSIDAFVSRRKRNRKTPLRYFLPTPFAQSPRIQRLVQKALDMGGDITNNPEHRISWCACPKASFGRRIVLLHKIINDMLQSHPERGERIVIATIGGGRCLFEYLLVDELLLAGYQDIHLINVDPLDQYFYTDNSPMSSGEIRMRLVKEFELQLKDRATVQSYIHGQDFCDVQGLVEPSVVYYSIPNFESWNTDLIPLADYVLTIDLIAESFVVNADAQKIDPCSRCNVLEFHGAEGGADIIRIVFDITPGSINDKTRPPSHAFECAGCVTSEGVTVLVFEALLEASDWSGLAGAILSKFRKARWRGLFKVIKMFNTGHVELFYNLRKVCSPDVRIYHLDRQRAQNVTSVFLENPEDPIRFMAQLFASN